MRSPAVISALAVMAALPLVLGACTADSGDDRSAEVAGTGASASPGEVDPDGTFSVIMTGNPEDMHPAQIREFRSIFVAKHLYRNLIEFDPQTVEPVNVVAESIETDDNQTFTITVADGWTFHDGEAINAQTFADSFTFVTDPEAAWYGSFLYTDVEGTDDTGLRTGEDLTGVEVIDDMTFTVTLKEPFSQWTARLAYPSFSPIPTVCREDPQVCRDQPIGNGPFLMPEPWEPDVQIVLERWEDYPGTDSAKAARVDLPIIPDRDTALLEVESGNHDIIWGLPPAAVQTAQEDFGDRFGQKATSVSYFFTVPMYDEHWGGDENLNRRRAFSLAIDRQALSETVAPQNLPADALIPPVIPGHQPGVCADCRYDPELAAELWEPVEDEVITIIYLVEDGPEVAEAMANQLRSALDVEVDLKSMTLETWLSEFIDIQAAESPYAAGWLMDYPSPENYLGGLLATSGDFYNAEWGNEEFDALIQAGNSAISQDEAIAAYQQAEALAMEELALIPLSFGTSTWVHSERVRGVTTDAFPIMHLENIEVLED